MEQTRVQNPAAPDGGHPATTVHRMDEHPRTPTGAIGQATPLRFSKWQIVLAVLIAGLSDAICASVVLVPPLVWAIDVVTAILLFVVLGWQWLLLPGLIFEAIPGLAVVPFWLLVVGAIVVWGTARPKLK